ncbi:MAG: MBL fold metallo-hydrolase [Bacillota bacterium]
MELTVLGNLSPYPTADGGCSSYLIQHDNHSILVDVGSGTLGNLEEVIPCHELDAVIISHLHLDHFLDLFPLHYAIMIAIQNGLRQEPLEVYLPFSASEELDFIRAKVGDEFHLQELKEDNNLQFGELEFNFHPTTHSKECLGIKLATADFSLGYTADTSLDESLIKFFKGTNLLLAEASLLEEDANRRSAGHMTVKDAVQFGTKAEVEKLLLTHLSSVYDQQDIKNEIPETDLEVELTKVLETYKING